MKQTTLDRAQESRKAALASATSTKYVTIQPKSGGEYRVRIASISAIVHLPMTTYLWYVRLDGQQLPIDQETYKQLAALMV